MRVRKLLPIVLLLGCAAGAAAQDGFVSITGWRVHAGDDPAWAQPDFDDSQWNQRSFPTPTFQENGSRGWHWYRATFQVPANLHGQRLALGMGPLDEAYEVYVDGVLIGRFGAFEPAPRAPYPRHISFPIPPGLQQGSIGHIAIRRWNGGWSVYLYVFHAGGNTRFNHLPRVGTAQAIDSQEKLDMSDGAIQMLPSDLTAILFLFAAAISFVLYSVQRRRGEYLYLGLACIANGASLLLGVFITRNPAIGGRAWQPALVLFVSLCHPALSNIFLAVLCPRFRKILLAGAVLAGVIAIGAAYAMAADSGLEVLLIFAFTYVLPLFPLIAVVGLLLDRDKGSLTIGLFLLLASATIVFYNTAFLLHRPVQLSAGPFFIDLRDIGSVLFIFVVLAVLYLRYRDEQARQAVAEQNLAAARRMQEQLLASSGVNPAGFEVAAVYRPAQEVGGDFYRTELLEDGSLLVVVGDVSGKGLDAALLVAAVLGGLAIEKEKRPAVLLEDLNKAVTGRTGGGFITACSARFYPDGRVVIANAGHISPCLDGREVELENGLPLGITAEASYSETAIETAGTVTFLSDGVAEARNAKGELLGFELMAALTARPAAEIADAAQRWGQEDDITVLTVKRLGSSLA